MNICVFGAASPSIDKKYIEKVEALGLELARRGHSLVFGAGGAGLMGAAARGTKKGGGNIYGFIPEFFKEDGIESIYAECTKLIYTETMRERKGKMEDAADAFIIVPGGIGTFEEFFEVLTLKQLRRHDKPIAVYNIDGYYDDINASLEGAIKKSFITANCTSLYLFSDDEKEIFDYIETSETSEYSVKELKEG